MQFISHIFHEDREVAAGGLEFHNSVICSHFLSGQKIRERTIELRTGKTDAADAFAVREEAEEHLTAV